MTTTIFDRDELDLIAALAGCSLDESPGSNWVQETGGLPPYICRIARAVKRSGKTTSQAIAIAVSRVKKWAAGGDDVDADTRAKAAKALAQWEAKKAKAKAASKAKDTVKASRPGGPHEPVLCLANEYNVDIVKTAFDQRQREAIRTWRAANPNARYDSEPPHLYVKEQWTSYLIAAGGYGEGRKLFKIPYSVAKDQTVTFADPVEVKTSYVVVKDSELGDDGTLSDADLRTLMVTACHTDTQALARVVAFARNRDGG